MADFELQKLIHALDKSEKIRFKGNCDEGAHYTALFDDLNDCPSCTEKEFKEKFQQQGYMKRYSYNKGYLFNVLLRAMRSQRQRGGMDKPIAFQVADWIEDADFLHEKMFHDLCWKRLQKAEKEAEKFELFEDLLKIKRFQVRMIIAAQRKNYHEDAKTGLKKLREYADSIKNKYDYHELRNQLFLLARTAPESRSVHYQNEISQMINHPLLLDARHACSFEAKLSFHFCKALIAQLKGDLHSNHYHHKKTYDLWLQFPQFQKEFPTQFRNTLNNFLLVGCAIHSFEHFTQAITLLEKGPFRSADEAAEAKQNGLYIRLQYFIGNCRWQDAIEVERDFKHGLEDFVNRMIPSRTMAFYMSFSRLNFITGELAKGIRWTERVLNIGIDQVRLDIRRHALLTSMIMYYEVGELSKLENRYRVVVRAFAKEKLALEFEREVLKLLYSLPRIPDKQNLHQKLHGLYDRMVILETNPKEKKALGFSFVFNWLESKIKGISMQEVLELKFRSDPGH